MLKARDLMSGEVFTLPATLSVGEAAWALMHRGVSGAPVRDAQGRLVGVVSNADLLDAERGADPAAAIDTRSVQDVMTPALLAVEEDDPAIEAVHLMVAHGVGRVLVLNADGDLRGIITPLDFMQRLLAEGHIEAEADGEAQRDGESDATAEHPTHH